jgi:hypothetical protein
MFFSKLTQCYGRAKRFCGGKLSHLVPHDQKLCLFPLKKQQPQKTHHPKSQNLVSIAKKVIPLENIQRVESIYLVLQLSLWVQKPPGGHSINYKRSTIIHS